MNGSKRIILVILFLIVCIISSCIYPEWVLTKDFRSIRWFFPAVAPIIVGSFFSLLVDQNKTFYSNYFKQRKGFLYVGIALFISPLYLNSLRLSFLPQTTDHRPQTTGIAILLTWVLFNQKAKITNLFNSKVLSYIGTISYGIYVYQGLFLRTGPGGKLWIQQFPQNLFLTFLPL